MVAMPHIRKPMPIHRLSSSTELCSEFRKQNRPSRIDSAPTITFSTRMPALMWSPNAAMISMTPLISR